MNHSNSALINVIRSCLITFTFGLFISIWSSFSASAMTYSTREGLTEGLERGKTEAFAQSVGLIEVELEDSAVFSFNAVLIDPRHILTTAHKLRDVRIRKGSFFTHHDINRMMDLVKSEPQSPEYKESLEKSSNLVVESFHPHPNPNVDLAVFTLKKPIHTPLLPILSEEQSVWGNGHLVSYGTSSFFRSATANQYIRHISVNPVQLNSLERLELKGADPSTPRIWLETIWSYRTSPLDISSYIFPEGAHRLLTVTAPTDSGAAFIVRNSGQYHLAGLHKGKIGLPDDIENNRIRSVIIPLYPYIDWIRGIVPSVATPSP